MPRPKKSKNIVRPKVEDFIVEQTVPIEKKCLCGHEEVVHALDCKQCWEVEKQFCGKKWFRCGLHGPHIETECEKLCWG